jgi:hypothetical protein
MVRMLHFDREALLTLYTPDDDGSGSGSLGGSGGGEGGAVVALVSRAEHSEEDSVESASASLWTIECRDEFLGELLSWGDDVRLRHVVTGA